MSNTIHLVVGKCGQYSDRREWVLAWYLCKLDAEGHAKAAKEEANKLLADLPMDECVPEDLPNEGKTPLDPAREFWCGDPPDYYVQAVERGKWPFPLPEMPK